MLRQVELKSLAQRFLASVAKPREFLMVSVAPNLQQVTHILLAAAEGTPTKKRKASPKKKAAKKEENGEADEMDAMPELPDYSGDEGFHKDEEDVDDDEMFHEADEEA